VAYFSSTNLLRFYTTFTPQFTTFLPSNHHIKNSDFAKNPCKSPQRTAAIFFSNLKPRKKI